MDEELKQHITAKDTWLRGLFILVFGFLLAVARVVTWAVVVLQFLFTLFTGRPNQNLLTFGASLAQYIYQCFTYVTFNSDVRPFPFNDWPESDLLTPADAGVAESAEQTAPPPKKAAPKKTSRKKSSVKKSTARKKAASPSGTDTAATGQDTPSTEEGGGNSPPDKPG